MKILFFSEQSQPSNIFKSVVLDFKFYMDFALVNQKETALVELFGVSSYPELVAIKSRKVISR